MMAAHEHSASYNEWNAKLEEAGAGEQRLDTPAGSHMFGKPSTGISLVYLLKELCGSLDVYGFGTHDSEGNPGDYKYYVMSRVVGKVSGGELGVSVKNARICLPSTLTLAGNLEDFAGSGWEWALTWTEVLGHGAADHLGGGWQPHALV